MAFPSRKYTRLPCILPSITVDSRFESEVNKPLGLGQVIITNLENRNGVIHLRKRSFLDYCNPRTDLAIEESERLHAQTGTELPGVSVDEKRFDDINVTHVNIFSDQGEKAMGKMQGNYITIDAPGLRRRDMNAQAQAADLVAEELEGLMKKHRNGGAVLVAGLGNVEATPDALGPQVVERMLVTRHLRDYLPPQLGERMHAVCAIAPGVLGNTGIESSDIIRGIVNTIEPGLVIIIDALAARNVQRIITSIQLSDTGIHPGSGVGNRREGLNRDTLGVPVIAVGVPTVVGAITIAANAIDLLGERLKEHHESYSILEQLKQNDMNRFINEVLNPAMGQLMVTPKEVDVLMSDTAQVLANGLNLALQPELSREEQHGLLH